MERETLLKIQSLTVRYPGAAKPILRDVDLTLEKGIITCVIGESGCGKTTLMNIIGAMDDLTEGHLLVEGEDFSHPSEKKRTEYRRNDIGFIFQDYHLMPNLSAIDNVRFIAELCKDPMTPAEALSRVQLSEKAHLYPAHLSGGEQQRVSIARALVKQPKLILADEPTAALDYQTGVSVLQAIRDIVCVHGTTVVMITHNAEIAKIADRVVRLRAGKIFEIKTNEHPVDASELVW
jgi:ABC-type lipoprotein export system ATPase subunit